MSSTNLPNTKEKIFSWIFSKDYLQISEGACDWKPFIIFLQIFYCWFSFDFPLDFKIQSENHEKIYSKILWVIKKIISLVPRSEILRKSEFKIWEKIRIIQIHRTHVIYHNIVEIVRNYFHKTFGNFEINQYFCTQIHES